jgi:uncharacterized protein (TIRG00374 family)
MFFLFKYVLYTLASISGVWIYFNFWGIENGTLGQQIVYAFSQLDVSMTLLFLTFWMASLFWSAFRYKMLGIGWGAHISLMTCLKATAISRALTLLTPTILIGGQPLGYSILTINGTPKRTAGGIVFIATILDIGLFLFCIPLLLYFNSTQDAAIMRYFQLILWITMGILLFIILCCWFLQSRYYYLAIRILAIAWSIVPSWEKPYLERMFQDWQKKFKSFFNFKILFSRNSLAAISSTVLIFLCHSIGVWFLLKGIGCHQPLMENIFNQFSVNAGTAILSPGGGTVTGEIGFKILIGSDTPQEYLYGTMFIFMIGSYWLNILVGIIFLLFEKIRKCTIDIRFMPKFYSSLSNDVKVILTSEKGEKMVQSPDIMGECSFMVPINSQYKYSVLENGKTILEKQLTSDKYRLDIQLGPLETPVVDHSIRTRILFKMYITSFLVKRFFGWIARRSIKGKLPLPRFWGNLFRLPHYLFSDNIILSPILTAYNRLPGPARKLVIRMISYYFEGRILRLDIQNREGWVMPDVLSIQLTNACNLDCAGCHVRKEKKVEPTFNMIKYVDLLAEFRSLGGRFVLLLGGEPMLMKRYIFQLTREFPELTFLLFSNGTCWENDDVSNIIESGNIIPLLSIDGDEQMTDARRGTGVFAKIKKIQEKFAARGMMHGVSVMVDTNNNLYIREHDFLSKVFDDPHHFTLFMAYSERNDCFNLKPLNQEMMEAFIHDLNIARQNGLLAVFLPYDEMNFFKGCGATRNLVHINKDFSIARCPYTYDYITAGNFNEGLRPALKKIQSKLPVNPQCLAQCRTQ